MAINTNYAQRLARVEKITEMIRSEQEDVMENAYLMACEEGDEELAASAARALRNRKLADSDSDMMFDRMDTIVPAGDTFTDWISYLKKLVSVQTGAIARYRADLRAMPEQEGFPFSIQWPVKPGIEQEDAYPLIWKWMNREE